MVASTRLVRPIPISRAQERFLKSQSWITGFVGGRGAGKTKIGCIAVAQKARNLDPWMCISPDANVLMETTFPAFVETVKYSGQYLSEVKSKNPTVTFRTWDDGVATLVFKGAEVPDKLRGPSKAGLWFDEASIISEEAFTVGIGMCRYKRKLSPIFATFTPRGFRHWTFEKFFSPIEIHQTEKFSNVQYFSGKPYVPQKRTNLIHCTTRDNPFAPVEYADAIGSNYSAMLREQELEGVFLEIAGLMFQRKDFRLVDAAPIECDRVRYWDRASTPNDGCYSAGALLARDRNGVVFVEHIVRGQWSAYDRNEIIRQTCENDFRRYNGTVSTYIEEEGGSGKEVVDQLIAFLGKYPVYRDSASVAQAMRLVGGVKLPGDAKVRRAAPLSAQSQAGNVRMVAGNWNADFLDEITCFPEYRYCDQVDAVCAAYNKLASFPSDSMAPESYDKPSGVRHYGRLVENSSHYDDQEDEFSYRRQRLPWL